MKTNEFLSLLNEHKDKSLIFEYTPGELVGANYHITEVKNITVDAVDCGGRVDFWKETIIQLWESPTEIDKKEFMSAYKALGILNKVDKIKPMEKDVEVKFEYSNNSFHTAQLFVHSFETKGQNLIISLDINPTDCKAKEACGVPEPKENKAVNSCAPGSGCC